MSRSLRVLLGVSGGIAAYKSAELVRRLRSRGHEVRCALTRSAVSFVTPLTLEVLSGHPRLPGGVPRRHRLGRGGAHHRRGLGRGAVRGPGDHPRPRPAGPRARRRLPDHDRARLRRSGGGRARHALRDVGAGGDAAARRDAEAARRLVRRSGRGAARLGRGGHGADGRAGGDRAGGRGRRRQPGRSPGGRCWSPPAPPTSRSIPSASWATVRAAGWASRSPPRRRGGGRGRSWWRDRSRCRPRRASPASTSSPRGRWSGRSTSTRRRPA